MDREREQGDGGREAGPLLPGPIPGSPLVSPLWSHPSWALAPPFPQPGLWLPRGPNALTSCPGSAPCPLSSKRHRAGGARTGYQVPAPLATPDASLCLWFPIARRCSVSHPLSLLLPRPLPFQDIDGQSQALQLSRVIRSFYCLHHCSLYSIIFCYC